MRRLVVVLVIASAIPVAAAAARPSMSQLEADALARNVLLQSADLPDYKQEPATDSPTEDIWGNGRVARCMGRKYFGKDLANVMSPSFLNAESPQEEWFGSQVMVMPNASIVRSALKKARSARGRRCLAHELRLGGFGKDAKVVKTSLAPL